MKYRDGADFCPSEKQEGGGVISVCVCVGVCGCVCVCVRVCVWGGLSLNGMQAVPAVILHLCNLLQSAL